MSRKVLLLAIFLPFTLLCLEVPSALAGGEAHTHDGFFLRLAAGAGSGGNKIEAGGDKLEISGTSGDLDIAIGAVVRPNLAIHGTLFGWSVSDPDVDVTISGVSGSGTAKGTATISAVGGGATYYLMPANVYLSGSAGFGTFSFDPDTGSSAETDGGLALAFTAGKEWWVANSWGLGVAVGYVFSSLPDKDVSENWSGNAFSVRFTATMN
jgi:hypothetical protein